MGEKAAGGQQIYHLLSYINNRTDPVIVFCVYKNDQFFTVWMIWIMNDHLLAMAYICYFALFGGCVIRSDAEMTLRSPSDYKIANRADQIVKFWRLVNISA
jgi:hypothetical protein